MSQKIKTNFDTWLLEDACGDEYYKHIETRHTDIDSIKEAFNNARSNGFRIDGLNYSTHLSLGFIVYETDIRGKVINVKWHLAYWSIFLEYMNEL